MEVVERTLNLHAYSLRKNNITVDFLKETGVPYALGDPHQLMQVFLNLDPERRAGDPRGARQRHAADPVGQRRRLSSGSASTTTGRAFRRRILPSIFDPFYTTKRPGRGTGLGLSICKSVMKEHNGSIEAANSPEGGAVFTVTLPVSGTG